MIDDYISLKEKFNNIKNMGWIESKRKGTTGIGYTFETLLGKEEESFPIPDYGTIEIKTRYRNSRYPISLFNATPDGDYLFPMQQLYDNYSFPYGKNKMYNVFYAKMSAVEEINAGRYNKFKLAINHEKQQIRIIVRDKFDNIKDTGISWSFPFLKEKIERKLKYLALIKADVHTYPNAQYFRYYKINFYMLTNFETFISLIESGIITVTFMIGCYSSGIKKGQMNNHGAAFTIDETNLEKLFLKFDWCG